MKFQKGDLVQIVNNLNTRKTYAMHYTKEERKNIIDRISYMPNDFMVEFRGQIGTIVNVWSDGYELDIVRGEVFTDAMLRKFEDRMSRMRQIHPKSAQEVEDIISHVEKVFLNSLIDKSLDEKDEKMFLLLSERIKEMS